MRLAPHKEQPAAHDLEVEIVRLAALYRNSGRSIECVAQGLLAAFYRFVAYEAKGDADASLFLAQRLLEGGCIEYSLALQKEKSSITAIYEERNLRGLSS